ncbi:glycosyltransferase family 4 protein [Halomonas sp. McH1-25]|uniref:glycosyltransferase family 4 protein n=1 Tax=unclassified Halomonas TaxID=2609666 RepID=UPI001EF46FC2|nr:MULTISPECIES: glycosyltransferase family 1 protein [unclassified Halomonas]MCG7601028.1 glycosyltransferase family 4 protein [Halomonas sp. McH1-25]MCP1342119.1 glycosyltransferase family 4 protein [Halomonas sp. FL8]MCP1360592.1 glycosyltransferase family 4 protein [Halomonas sp. BBD45]MCP1365934.1 glycosyltransferase family 4 protein [Halomonas sp. BBD48]
MIQVNGKYLKQEVTGVQRVANEIVSRLACQKSTIVPSKKNIGGMYSIMWEQLVLPTKLQVSDMLFSPCNVGPITHAKQVVCIHDVAVLDHPEWFSRSFYLYYDYVLTRLSKKASFITTVSDFSKRRICQVLGVDDGKVEVIPNGVSDVFFNQPQSSFSEVKEKFSLPEYYILCVGSFDGRKNQERLVEAWEKIHKKHTGIKLVFTGGRGRAFNDSLMGPGLADAIFTGYVDENDLVCLYRNCLMFVYPSIYEGFGLPVLEAMASGVPVITSLDSPMEEISRGGSLLVNPKSPDDIAEAIDELICNESLCSQLSSFGVEKAKKYSWDFSANRYDELFRKIN